MMKNSASLHTRNIAWSTALLVVVLVLLTAADAGANDVINKLAWRNTVEAEGSFNYARRDIFRNLYGNGLTIAIKYERVLNERIGLGVRLSRIQLCDAEEYSVIKLKYRDFAIVPMMTYTLTHTGGLRLFSGGGAGFSFRKIALESSATDETIFDQHAVNVAQTEATVLGLVMLGADIRLGRSLFFGARVTWDHHFFGDVEVGDFGDTGGFNFGGSLGFGF
ncbi:MAG: hypothetical protein JSV52_12190 [Candidatus Zixiibacteriota bacterium]|nr:MAG: hypothetical protein JSV52_12190 [candidate division Zixibacteria bacterium]